ncbi:MAG: hypothetical protein JWP74_2231 [Marmoricola sp.]|nr:hypothetical protein [Marmoricola sp.]
MTIAFRAAARRAAPVADRGGFVAALRSLTLRGRGFVAAGITAAVCGVAMGERDLVRIGALVLLLPVVTAGLVTRSKHRLSLTRTLTSTQIEVGQTTAVHLDLTNLGSRTGLLLLEEHLPWALGQRPRFVVDAMQPGWHRRFDYPVHADVRGIYELGPMRVRVADPFGMLALHRPFTRTTSVVVVPATEPLPPIPLLGAWTGTGDNRPRPFSSGSAADVTVREYRHGDDLRRVHWRSSAKTGELMVRREEQPWQSRCTLFLDNRARAHRGAGPDSSLERAVTVAASIAVHLAGHGFQVRLVSADGEADVLGAGEHAWHDGDIGTRARPLLEKLAALPTSAAAEISTGWVDETVTAGMVIGVLGALSDRDRVFMSRLHTRGNASYAIALDVETWAGRAGAGSTGRPGNGETASWLQQRGWKAATLDRGASLPAAWQELGR